MAYLPNEPNSEGKRNLRFQRPPENQMDKFSTFDNPCGKCSACESLRSLKTAVQLYAECMTSKEECYFLTLTFDDEHLPKDGSVRLKDIQNFNKSIRKFKKRKKQKPNYRNLYVGEYGGRTSRAHYHIIAFNLNISDLEEFNDEGGHMLYVSKEINKIWGKGNVTLMRLNFENCVYVAQHHFKEKLTRKQKVNEITYLHPVNLRLIKKRQSEFTHRSCSPGIGKEFFLEFKSDIFPCDYMIINGQKKPLPDYFSKLLKTYDPQMYELVINNRVKNIEYKTDKQHRYQSKYNLAILKSKGKI